MSQGVVPAEKVKKNKRTRGHKSDKGLESSTLELRKRTYRFHYKHSNSPKTMSQHRCIVDALFTLTRGPRKSGNQWGESRYRRVRVCLEADVAMYDAMDMDVL